MKPSAFDYRRPDRLDEALGILAEHGSDARVLAGGQSLVPMMNFRMAQPLTLVDLNRVQELSYIRERDDGYGIAIGAMVRQAAIEDSALVAERCPLLTEATSFMGSRPIRNRGTVGGCVAHADPAAEYPAALVALGADIRLVSASGERVVPADEFFHTFFTTATGPTEIVAEIQIPTIGPRTGWAFTEQARKHNGHAVIGVATVVSLDREGRCTEARIVLSGVGPTPIRCRSAEEVLEGKPVVVELLETAATSAADSAQPADDVHATAEYRRAMVPVYVRRALRTALDRAESHETEESAG